MRKPVWIAMLLGFCFPLLWGALNAFFHSTGVDWPPDSPLLAALNLVLLVVTWPTVILIPLEIGWEPRLVPAFAISTIANVILYGIVVSRAIRVREILKDRRSGGWWPAPPSD